MAIKNIIFDLGGVIINIDYQRTSSAFHRLGANNFDLIFNQNKQDHFIDDYEIGKIESDEFRLIVTKKLDIKITDDEFDDAWNAMLLDIPMARLDFIKDLRKRYRVYLFSNTNHIHLTQVFNICQTQNGFDSFDGYFDKEYYSNIYGKRKPHPESFKAILDENDLKAHETLFVDDSLQHIQGATNAGLEAIHLLPGQTIYSVADILKRK